MKGEALVVTALLWCCFILLVAGNESSGIYSVTFTAPNTWALVTGKVDGCIYLRCPPILFSHLSPPLSFICSLLPFFIVP